MALLCKEAPPGMVPLAKLDQLLALLRDSQGSWESWSACASACVLVTKLWSVAFPVTQLENRAPGVLSVDTLFLFDHV